VRAVPTAAIVQALGAEIQGRGIADELRALERERRTELRRPVRALAIAASGRVAA
jgi:hypothetical protein